MSLRTGLYRTHWLMSAQVGVDLIKMFRLTRGIPRYLRDLFLFRETYTGRLELTPCLHDWYEEGGGTKTEYFWQDLLVARKIFSAKPEKHIDIGSRVDGFVAHVASFREIEVFDVRPITTQVPGVVFRQADIMQPVMLESVLGEGYCDSLSCLHAIEHFGLGRYADPIDPRGYEQGIANMARLLKPSGSFYLSTPIGKERVEFNANRVFDPRTIIDCAEANGLQLKELSVISGGTTIREAQPDENTLQELSQCHYNLGIFTFIKSAR